MLSGKKFWYYDYIDEAGDWVIDSATARHRTVTRYRQIVYTDNSRGDKTYYDSWTENDTATFSRTYYDDWRYQNVSYDGSRYRYAYQIYVWASDNTESWGGSEQEKEYGVLSYTSTNNWNYINPLIPSVTYRNRRADQLYTFSDGVVKTGQTYVVQTEHPISYTTVADGGGSTKSHYEYIWPTEPTLTYSASF